LLDANGLELADNYLESLPDSARGVVKGLQPAGKINLHARIKSAHDSNSAQSSLAVECLGNSITVPKIPYPIRDIYGRVVIDEDGISFENLNARFDSGSVLPQILTASGRALLDANGFKGGTFKASISNLRFDDQKLENALPIAIRNVYKEFSPKGYADLDSNEIVITRLGSDVNSIHVKSRVKFKDCSFIAGVPINRLNADLAAAFLYTAKDGNIECSADFDAQTVEVKNRLLENVRCHAEYNDLRKSIVVKDITADIYGGRACGSFRMTDQGYVVDTVFSDVDLKEFAAPSLKSGSGDFTTGKMSGSISMYSPSDQNEPRTGNLQFSVRQMQVAKISLLGKLLLVLKLTEPTDYAFDHLDARGYINRSDILIDELDLFGKSLALRGAGKLCVSEPATVDLSFYAAGPRIIAAKPSLIRSILDGFTPAVARINVSGKLTDPRIDTTTLPVIKDTLGIIGTRLPGSKKK
jgi:hypothetical protein